MKSDNRMRAALPDMKQGTQVRLHRLPSAHKSSTLADDALVGLRATPKSLPPKYFYDEYGSALFEQICATPEYYPTRTEEALLVRHAHSIIEAAQPRVLIELGSGSSRKTCHLFSACADLGLRVWYQPLDVCEEVLRGAAQQLVTRYPWLFIDALIGDYAVDLSAIPILEGPRLFIFLGSTIGNLTESEALVFLRKLREVMQPSDHLLLGLDRVKEKARLDAAYNDAAGLTAAFNLNVLKVLNECLDSNFDIQAFRHAAWFDEAKSQIEMHLISRRTQSVVLPRIQLDIELAEGESIMTEISRKFTPESMRHLLHAAGFVCERHDEPDDGAFSLVLARRTAG